MLRKRSFTKRSATLVLLAFGVLLGAAWAQTETVLYSFCAQSTCTDGLAPYAGVIFDQKGDLYGTTYNGGANGQGVVFKLTPKGKETVLHSFCWQPNGCNDGAFPYGGLIFDREGSLYGTTEYGGAYNEGLAGTVFELTAKGKETVLYSFCAQSKCADGAMPEGGLIFDPKENLYGTTVAGGSHDSVLCLGLSCGVVFKVTPKGKETVLYSFCARQGCTDGLNPVAGLVFDQKGNLYGTTVGDEVFLDGNIAGVVFRLTPDGRETVLYKFCAQIDCTDGGGPYAGLIFDRKGNLYGTAFYGGAYGGYSGCAYHLYGCGVVFKVTPKGSETVLYSFCAQSNCADGELPQGGLIFDPKGNLYGTTASGGAYDGGTVFKITPEGKEIVLYSFCAQSNCSDGSNPTAGLVFDRKGNLYGTTVNGGPSGGGVVFKITP
jgi:uncharacterized repeat protein (TIGR03803 family)